MKILGIAASDGIIISKVFKLENIELKVPENVVSSPDKELIKLQEVLEQTTTELGVIRDITAKKIDEEHAIIFDAHIQIANDPEMFNQVKDLIMNFNNNAAYAFMSVSETFATIFDSMDSEYMRERAVDVRDVSRKLGTF